MLLLLSAGIFASYAASATTHMTYVIPINKDTGAHNGSHKSQSQDNVKDIHSKPPIM